MSNVLSATRVTNMEKRRRRIREAARDILLEDGPSGLTTRRLAAAAGVTAQTVYNLTGPIADILASLIADGVAEIEDQLAGVDQSVGGLKYAESLVSVIIDVTIADRNSFKAVGLAAEIINLQNTTSPTGRLVIARAVHLFATAFEVARKDGWLAGRIDHQQLAETVVTLQRNAYRDWCRDEFDDDEYRRVSLRGLFICLLADVTLSRRPKLLGRLAEVTMSNASIS